MSFIEKSVARLDQQDRLEALALELGKSHYHYSAPPKYYSVRHPWITHWCVHSQFLMMPLCLKGNSHVLFLATKLLPFIARSMKWRRQQTEWTHTLALFVSDNSGAKLLHNRRLTIFFIYFFSSMWERNSSVPFSPSWRKGGRPSWRRPGRWGASLCALNMGRTGNPLWVDASWNGSMCATSHICVPDGWLMCASPEPYMRSVRKMERGSATTRHVTCVVHTERQRVRLMLRII